MRVTDFKLDEILSSVGFKLLPHYPHSLNVFLQSTPTFRKVLKILL